MQNLGIIKINEQADQIPGCIRFDKGSSKFSFPEAFLPYIDRIKGKIKGKYFQYPSTGGEPILKEHITKIESKNHRFISPHNIIITHGGMSGLFTIFAVLTKPTDEVITNNYCFEGFSALSEHFNLSQKRVDISSSQEVEKAITSRTKIILLNSPENPTGKVYSKTEIDNLVNIAEKYNIWLIADEVMHRIIYQNNTWYSSSLEGNKAIVVNSFSKSWFIPGIRVGWIVTKDLELAQKCSYMLSIQSDGVNLFGQLFMSELLADFDYEAFLKGKLEVLYERKNLFEDTLKCCNISYFHEVQGGMNFYINLKKDSKIIAKKLLNNFGVAIIPGCMFEGKDSSYARVGFGAVNKEDIVKGIEIIASTVSE